MFDSFDSFITATLGQTIGEGECFDYINLLWSHLGSRYWTFPPSDPDATNHGVKWGWDNLEAREANTITHLTQITRLSDVRRGDMVVTSGGEYGHAGFASSSYDGSGYLALYSQNYASTTYVTLDPNDMTTFAGAWRYDAWNKPPTPVTVNLKRKPFNWAIYARKLRDKR